MPETVTGDGIHIYYEVHGEGEPLLLIQGLGGDISKWFRLLPVLAAECRAITFDNRGVGRSDRPDTPYSMEMMADDAAAVLDALNIEKAHIFGISMGGMIAQNFALRHPGRVISLILGCTRCGGTHSVTEGSIATSPLNPERLRMLTVEQRAREMLPFLWSKEFIENNPDLVEEQVATSLANPIDPAAYERQLQAANAHDTFDRLPGIKAPTLVIAGGSDRLIPVANSGTLASRIPGAELVILDNLGHGFYSEAVAETSEIILDFIKRNSQASGTER